MPVGVSIQKKTHTVDHGILTDNGQVVIMTKCGFSMTTVGKKNYNTNRYRDRSSYLPVAKLRHATCPRCCRYDNVYLRIPRFLKYIGYRALISWRKLRKRLT